jgi:hypothetical protein
MELIPDLIQADRHDERARRGELALDLRAAPARRPSGARAAVAAIADPPANRRDRAADRGERERIVSNARHALRLEKL